MLKNLDAVSGVLQPVTLNKDGTSFVFDIAWKNGVHLIAVKPLSSLSPYFYAERGGEKVSAVYPCDIRLMQNMVYEIESGRYNNKKTGSEKLLDEINRRGLVSCMNNTKWNELFGALRRVIPDILIKYRMLSDDKDPDDFYSFGEDEFLEYTDKALIEWFAVCCFIDESRYIGRLVKPKVTVYDKSADIKDILERYDIPYEYHDDEKAFYVYGYR